MVILNWYFVYQYSYSYIQSRKLAGSVLGLFIASMVKGAVAAGVWECGVLDFFEGHHAGKILCITEISATVACRTQQAKLINISTAIVMSIYAGWCIYCSYYIVTSIIIVCVIVLQRLKVRLNVRLTLMNRCCIVTFNYSYKVS